MNNYRSLCPVNLSLEVFGDKWSLLILRDIMFAGKRHFRELMQSEEKIASNILADRLNMLEAEGIITRKQDPDHKQKNIFSLTRKGIDLVPVILAMGAWSFKYQPADKVKHKHAALLIRGGKPAELEVMKMLLKEHV